MRLLFYVSSLAIIVWATVAVPLPLLTLAPAEPTSSTEAVNVEGAPDELNGELLITTVAVLPTTTAEAFTAVFDGDRDLTVRTQLVPPGVDEDEFFEQQREIFRESVQVATAVGLELAGQEVQLEGSGAEVMRVIPGAPAEGVLEEGDIIVEADGEPVRLASELQALTTAAQEGDTFTLTVERDGERVEVEVTIGFIPQADTVGIGVLAQTHEQRVALPEGVEIDTRTSIGGPSGGLMLALTVFDLFEESDLARGRVIAGTGTVTRDGEIGAVGGVDKKLVGASRAGADIFLVPAALEDLARQNAPEGLQVIPVATVQDAIEALQR